MHLLILLHRHTSAPNPLNPPTTLALLVTLLVTCLSAVALIISLRYSWYAIWPPLFYIQWFVYMLIIILMPFGDIFSWTFYVICNRSRYLLFCFVRKRESKERKICKTKKGPCKWWERTKKKRRKDGPHLLEDRPIEYVRYWFTFVFFFWFQLHRFHNAEVSTIKLRWKPRSSLPS